MDDFDRSFLSMNFAALVALEIPRAQELFPSEKRLAAAIEEAGEVAKQLLEMDPDSPDDWNELVKECVQAAAMFGRIAIEGDPTLGVHRPPFPSHPINAQSILEE
ncbi:MAG: hypothetical protein AAFU34_15650 [Pseudomonadota bacterium]